MTLLRRNYFPINILSSSYTSRRFVRLAFNPTKINEIQSYSLLKLSCPSIAFSPDEDIPDLSGKVILVTGGNAGLGFETIRQLSKHNPAHIYLAARSREKGGAAIKKLKELNPLAAPITFLSLDLASFDSIKAAAQTFRQVSDRLDVLINNAGIMMTPESLTKEEMRSSLEPTT